MEFLQEPDEYERVALAQGAWVRTIAKKIESGEPLELDHVGCGIIADILRDWADNLSTKPKGKQGPKPKFDNKMAAYMYARGRQFGRTHKEAGDAVFDSFHEDASITRQALDKAIKEHRAEAFALLRVPDPDRNQ